MGAHREPDSFPASEDNRVKRMRDGQQEKQKRDLMKQEAYEKLVQRLSERVWQMWIVELRHDQERRGQRRGQ
jgi:hypothetical protein